MIAFARMKGLDPVRVLAEAVRATTAAIHEEHRALVKSERERELARYNALKSGKTKLAQQLVKAKAFPTTAAVRAAAKRRRPRP
jgi:hypothetical protein